MSLKQIQALLSIKRSSGREDMRNRSPKSMGDMSGILLNRTGAPTGIIQQFDYDTLAKVHMCNDMVWTCLELVSSTAALGKLKVRKRLGKDIQFLPDHPLQQALDSPNASMTQFDLIQAYTVHQRLYGTVSILLLRQGMVAACPLCLQDSKEDCMHKLYAVNEGPVSQFMPIHPANLIQKKVEIDGKIGTYFFYTPAPNKEYIIHPNNILTDPFYNTTTGWYGISPTWLLKRWIDMDHSMTSQVQALFDNGSIPSMIINMKPGTNYTYEQEPESLMTMMKQKWVEQFSGKSGNQKTPAFVYGDISVERLQDKIDQSLSKGLYYEIQNRIMATYGVPPTLYEMGMKYGGQRASAEQSEKDFFNRTISKILIRFENKINQLVVPSYKEEGLEVVWDLAEMGIASFLIESKKAAVRTDWELGLISRDMARTLLGYEPMGGELGDDLYRLSVTDGGGSGTASDNQLKIPRTTDGTTHGESITPLKTIFDV